MHRTVTTARPSQWARAQARRRDAARADLVTGLVLAAIGCTLILFMVAGAISGTWAAGMVLGQPFGV